MHNNRPKWYNLALWLIPVVAWIALFSIFNLRNQPPMKTLLETQNIALLNKVESYLQKKGIVYIRKENNHIAIDASEHSRISKQLTSIDGFEDDTSIKNLNIKKGS